jgi:hypothetical protein
MSARRAALAAVLMLACLMANAQPIWQQYLSLPNGTLARDHLEQLTSRPHLAGTEGDAWTADFVESQFRSFGLDVKRYSFDVYLPFPGKASLQGVPPFQYEATLHESAFPQVRYSTCLLFKHKAMHRTQDAIYLLLLLF